MSSIEPTDRTAQTTGPRPLLTSQTRAGLAARLNVLDARLIGWWACHGITLLRLSLGMIFSGSGSRSSFPA
ncbi:hypothetical protein ACFSC4_25680 [Deinococcus malanensis]|uniref:hypothetical protein n=1 Tax=Deinococcus malanensis TaxID=1706855 RepID=UPI003637D6CF